MKKNILSKIIIGTAQLSKNYGKFNTKGNIKTSEFKKILIFCKKKNILFLDLANGYKNSLDIVSKNNISKFNINLKISQAKKDFLKNIKLILKQTLKKLKIKKIYSLMLHDEKDIKYFKEKKILDYFLDLKKKKIIKKIGISIYDFKKINFYLSNYPIDLIQVPFNVFDQRILNKKNIKLINSKKIEVHARSIFLQGLLLQHPDNQQILIKKNLTLIKKWHYFNKKKIELKIINCIKFINQFKFINRFILGIDDIHQLKMIINLIKKMDYNSKIDRRFSLNKNKIIDPRLW